MVEKDRNSPELETARVEMYTRRYCGYCVRAKQLLENKDVVYTELSIDEQPELRQVMIERSGAYTVPQIFINGHAMGGCTELFALEQQGRLDELLA